MTASVKKSGSIITVEFQNCDMESSTIEGLLRVVRAAREQIKRTVDLEDPPSETEESPPSVQAREKQSPMREATPPPPSPPPPLPPAQPTAVIEERPGSNSSNYHQAPLEHLQTTPVPTPMQQQQQQSIIHSASPNNTYSQAHQASPVSMIPTTLGPIRAPYDSVPIQHVPGMGPVQFINPGHHQPQYAPSMQNLSVGPQYNMPPHSGVHGAVGQITNPMQNPSVIRLVHTIPPQEMPGPNQVMRQGPHMDAMSFHSNMHQASPCIQQMPPSAMMNPLAHHPPHNQVAAPLNLANVPPGMPPHHKIKHTPDSDDGDEDQKGYVCDVPDCKTSFEKLYQLQAHLFKHYGYKPYTCVFCGAAFYRADELERHSRTHTEKKGFDCRDCGKTFLRKDHLAKHMSIHQRQKKMAEEAATSSLITSVDLEANHMEIDERYAIKHDLKHTNDEYLKDLATPIFDMPSI